MQSKISQTPAARIQTAMARTSACSAPMPTIKLSCARCSQQWKKTYSTTRNQSTTWVSEIYEYFNIILYKIIAFNSNLNDLTNQFCRLILVLIPPLTQAISYRAHIAHASSAIATGRHAACNRPTSPAFIRAI